MKKKFLSTSVILGIFLITIVACNKRQSTTTGDSTSKFVDGSYSASAQGFGGDVKVNISVKNNEIASADIVGDKETANIGGAAIPKLKESILKNNEIEWGGGLEILNFRIFK